MLSKHGLFVELFWEYNQPSISRGNMKKSWGGLMLSQINRIVNKIALPTQNPDYNQGTYELAILARKCKQS